MAWALSVIDGTDAGRSMSVSTGDVLIGTGDGAAMRLTSANVSKEHALLSIQNGDAHIENLSARGTQVNGKTVQGRQRIRLGDRIQLAGDAVLSLESEQKGRGSSTRLLVAAAASVLLVIALVLFVPQSKPAPARPNDWNRAFDVTTSWFDQQARQGNLPPELGEQFMDAYRFERGGFYPRAAEAWGRLELLIGNRRVAAAPERPTFREAAVMHPEALEAILKTGAGDNLSPTQHAAAVMQFVQRSRAYAQRMAEQ